MSDGEQAQRSGQTKCGFVALIGAPNAGKSTLLNQLVGAKVSIVTHKVQTTRSRIRGIALHKNTQMVFVDTPGIFKPRRRLDRAMVDAAWEGVSDGDLTVLIVDAEAYVEGGRKAAKNRSLEDVDRIIEGLKEADQKAVLVLNKIDLMKRDNLLAIVSDLNERFAFDETFLISAERGDGVSDLQDYLSDHLPESPWLYPEDQMADVSLRMIASEITREKLMLRLHQELPYAMTVETEQWQEKKDGSVRIEQVIFVERDGQKGIVLGKRGETMKEIGKLAREEMQESFGHRVHLFLFVKVREKWGDDPERYRMMGLDFPKQTS